jgi:hypothetical protein
MPTHEVEPIRTVRIYEEDGELLESRRGSLSASAVITRIFQDFVDGKLVVRKPRVRKTTIWVEPKLWKEVLAKVKEEGVTTTLVISAGIRALKKRTRK